LLLLTLAFLGATGAPLSATAITLEAENGTLVGTVVSTAVPGYSGTGYVTGFNNLGDLVRWNFNATNGLHRLLIRYRTPYGQKGFDATVNGSIVSGMFPQTNSFATFNAGLVELVDGANTLQISGGWNWYEIDRADLVATTTPAPPLPVPAMLVDTQATFAARMLMADLVADYGKLAWSGQHDAAEVTSIFNISGRKPVIVSGDFIEYSPSRIAYGANPGLHTESQIALEAAGHVQAMCWHWNAPTNLLNTPDQPWWKGFYTEATTFDVAAALANPNSPEYALLLRDMDAIAAQLKKFASNNIPVLWRPLHEAEGAWFWWGAKGAEPYKQLWRLLFNRLTTHHDLHNLIWVLTSEDPGWYPGDDAVDIIGVDGYPTDRSDPLSGRWEALQPRFDGKKLVALSEFGGVPDIEKMHRFGVWFAYFAPWSGAYGPTSMPTNTVVRIYQSSEVLTLDESNAVPPRTLSVTRPNGGPLLLAGTGPRGAAYRILASTNPTVPMTNWSQLASSKFAGGVFTFADTQATNFPLRCYRVARP
jgi:mannan endo-1,4-beta-mannosidase